MWDSPRALAGMLERSAEIAGFGAWVTAMSDIKKAVTILIAVFVLGGVTAGSVIALINLPMRVAENARLNADNSVLAAETQRNAAANARRLTNMETLVADNTTRISNVESIGLQVLCEVRALAEGEENTSVCLEQEINRIRNGGRLR